MAVLYLHNRQIRNVFSLLGTKENDITYSIAWGLASSPNFLKGLLKTIVKVDIASQNATLLLQHHEGNAGITDLEIVVPGICHLIVEAKRGWNLPDLSQLEGYAKRLSFQNSKVGKKFLVTLSECSSEYSNRTCAHFSIDGTPVVHMSWKEVVDCTKTAASRGSHFEKQILRELKSYLEGVMTTQRIDSNMVYVVSLSSGRQEGWNISWVDIVTKKSLYFHPAGKGWPAEPPNYLAFRYDGKLQSIHHVEGYELVEVLTDRIPEIPRDKHDNHKSRFLYSLGKPFAPAHDMPTGGIFPSGRVWCMLDTLFTSPTIAEARDITQKRQQLIEN
jgi:hypothetical protein